MRFKRALDVIFLMRGSAQTKTTFGNIYVFCASCIYIHFIFKHRIFKPGEVGWGEGGGGSGNSREYFTCTGKGFEFILASQLTRNTIHGNSVGDWRCHLLEMIDQIFNATRQLSHIEAAPI